MHYMCVYLTNIELFVLTGALCRYLNVRSKLMYLPVFVNGYICERAYNIHNLKL